jgi:hypothetical protein
VISHIAEHWAFPVFVPFYSCGVPFAYPPLGFTLHAIALSWFPGTLLSIMLWSAVTFSILSLVAFVFLARTFLTGLALEFAVLGFSTVPVFALRITASDCIRNLALFLFLLTLVLLRRELTQGMKPLRAVAVGLLFGLTVLTHPPTALALSLVALLFFLDAAPTRGFRWLCSTGVAVAGIALLVAAPWMLWLYEHHGAESLTLLGNALLSRPHRSVWVETMLNLGKTAEPYAPVWGVLGVVGLLYAWMSRQGLLAWWFLLTPLHWCRTVNVTPLILGAGITLGQVLAPAFQRTLRRSHVFQAMLLMLLVGYSAWSALVFFVSPEFPLLGRIVGDRELRPQITEARLQAWEWMARHMERTDRFVVIAEEKEWVPASARVCANIPQGAEWAGNFLRYGDLYNDLLGTAETDELVSVLDRYRQPLDYLYLTTGASARFRKDVVNAGGNLRTLYEDLRRQRCSSILFQNSEVVLFDLRACQENRRDDSSGLAGVFGEIRRRQVVAMTKGSS